jgi:ankyrin repeat protein
VQCLIKELGADPNRANSTGWRPVHCAAQQGHLSVVQCLVKELGADINQTVLNRTTPLMTAAAYKHTEVVMWLIKHGADAQASKAYLDAATDISRKEGFTAADLSRD